MTTDLIAKETEPANLSPMQTAIQLGLTPEQAVGWMEAQQQWERNEAARAFSVAMTDFQGKCPTVKKKRKAGEGGFGYSYAAYEDVMAVAGPVLKECGLALTFSTEHDAAGIKVTCRIRHGIHFEDHTLTVPVPSMRVNDTQRYGAALSYAKRYALCAALNIVVADEDTDASGLDEPVTLEQAAMIREWTEQIDDFKLPAFLKWANAATIESIPASKFDQAVDFLQRKAKR